MILWENKVFYCKTAVSLTLYNINWIGDNEFYIGTIHCYWSAKDTYDIQAKCTQISWKSVQIKCTPAKVIGL